MFWDKISGLYDLFENVYNKKVYKALGSSIAAYVGKDDVILECACGTGAISKAVAVKCKKLVAVDLSIGSGFENTRFFVIDGRIPCAVAVITKS